LVDRRAHARFAAFVMGDDFEFGFYRGNVRGPG
jgi:hypothetical protein